MDFVYGNIKHTLINDTITGIIINKRKESISLFEKREIIVQIIELNIIAVVLYLDA